MADSELPTVAVPMLDLFTPSENSDTKKLWADHFEDWVPKNSQRSAAHTLPSFGLQELADTASAAAKSYPPSPGTTRLAREIQSLVGINKRSDDDNHAE